jgi:carboxymethylenebutenolidase
MGSMITLTAADGFPLSAYRAEPAGTPKGGVVVIQEIFGVNSHIRSVADRYAQAGFLAIAPALFDRIEQGIELGYAQEDIEQGIAIARGKVDPDAVMLDLAAAAQAAREAGKVGCVGYCWGGMLAARCAIDGIVDAAVSYYGGGVASLVGDQPAAPLLMHFGQRDHAIPLADVDKVRQAWPQAEVHVYDGAEHGFNCDQRASFHQASADVARGRSEAFLTEHLAG